MPFSETQAEIPVEFSESPETMESLRAERERLKVEIAELRDLAMKDSKTGLWNDRGLREVSRVLIQEHARSGAPLSLLVLDIDNLKDLNSRLGNPEVDRLMNEAGQELMTLTRQSDVVARHGGDEFVILFTADQAQIMRKFLNPETGASEVRLQEREVKGERVSITFSGGIAELDLTKPDQSFDDALERAFQAQIKAKQNKGRIEPA